MQFNHRHTSIKSMFIKKGAEDLSNIYQKLEDSKNYFTILMINFEHRVQLQTPQMGWNYLLHLAESICLFKYPGFDGKILSRSLEILLLITQ